MAVGRLVIEWQTLGDSARQAFGINEWTAIRDGRKNLFHEIEQIAPITIRHHQKCGAGVRCQRQLPLLKQFGPPDKAIQTFITQAVQHQNLATRQQRAVEFERRVLRSGADERDRSIFDERQEGILLGLVEAVNLIHEQQRRPALLAPHAGLVEGLLEIGNTGKNRRHLFEHQTRGASQQARNGGLARSRWPPEDD